ncbi:hypothetical protein M0R45_014389 [Rubus argutus]|uniref:Ubiquitin-like protease family profile domain-containing protein n=1 Tax=Rubus argutus TaxID=59490 RepID=A0AAW1XMI4_RUBAR
MRKRYVDLQSNNDNAICFLRSQVASKKMRTSEAVDTSKNTTKAVGDQSKTNISVPYEEQLMVRSADGVIRVTRVKSPKEFIDTVGMLPPNKVIAICGMGFGSIQLIGCPILAPNVLQLMVEGMDTTNEKIRIHGKEFSVTASDFGRIMGLKDGGNEVDLNGDLGQDLIQAVLRKLAGQDGELSLTALKRLILDRADADGMFKVAYAMFAFAALLCPGGNNEVDKSLILALMDYNAISEKNWATYCFRKLFSSVQMFKSKGSMAITGCMIFLQLFYFETVGNSLSLVDRTITPLFGWGVDQVKRLLFWVDYRGGIIDSNVNVWPGRKESPQRFAKLSSDGKLEPHNIVRLEQELRNSKAELEIVKAKLSVLEQTVAIMEPSVAELKTAVALIQRASPGFHGHPLDTIVVEATKRVTNEKNNNEGGKKAVKNSVEPAGKCGPLVSGSGQHACDGTTGSGDYSLKMTGYRNKDEAFPDELKIKPTTGDKVVKGQLSDTSQLSVSPTVQPKITSRSNKQKLSTRSTAIPRKISRALLKARATRVAKNFKRDHAKNSKKMESFKIAAGPFLVNFGTPANDIALLKFIFIQSDAEELKISRLKNAVLARVDNTHVTREDLSSLGPQNLVDSHVINMFAAYLSSLSWTDWFFPTYFGDRANNYEEATGYTGWVAQTRSCCGLNSLATRINDCRRIFIPMREPSEIGHWYLLVVHVKEKKAEIVDSAPDNRRDSDRLFAARLALNMLDSVFMTEVMTLMDDRVLFGAFDFVPTKVSQLQPNSYDCGVFVIRNMERLGDNWAANYVSEDHRIRLIVECVRNPLNMVEGLQEIIEEVLAPRATNDGLAPTSVVKTIPHAFE